jgi:O-antigen/teichoic acid export membrane protein
MKQSNSLQAFWVAIGSLFSFGFGLISSMILSRYLTKEDYGTYKQVLYVYNTLLVVFTLGIPKAFSFFLPRVPLNETKNLIKKITNLLFLLGGFFSVLLFVCSRLISILLNNPNLANALKIFSLVPLLMLPTMGLDGILSTFRKVQFLTIYTVVTRCIMLFCITIPIIFFNGNYLHAIIGFVCASIIAFILALYFKYIPVKNIEVKKCNVTYADIFNFSFPLLVASIFGIIFASADQFFISKYFGTVVFAEFSNGALDLPFTGMIVGACATVLSPIFSRLSNETVNPQLDIFPIWKSVFEKSSKLIYPLLLFCWFFADILMAVLYGDKYENSFIYFRIKSIINFFTLIVYGPLLISIGKVKYYSNVLMVGTIVLIILESLSVLICDSPYMITAISVICRFGQIFAMLAFVAKYFEVRIYHLFPAEVLLKIVIVSILILLPIHYLLVDVFLINKLLTLSIGFVLYAVIFFVCSYFMKIDYLSIIKSILSFKIK